MKILLVNKYLYRKGGAETYFIKLGEYLKSLGNEVEYFGMADERNCVGNRVEAYTENIDFHKKSLKHITYPFKIIYSVNARKQIRKVLSDFKPDVVHLNNFNYQLTPSIIYEIKKHNIPIVYTAHDVQLVCPNHKLKNDYTDGLCRKCDGGKYFECVKNNCVHSSKIRSILGAVEAWYYKLRHTYKMIDLTVCPSEFMEKEISRNDDINGRTVTMYNFIDEIKPLGAECENYVLYFGRYSEEKGISNLVKAAKKLSNIPFVFAGKGELENEVNSADNIKNVGFKTGDELRNIIEKALFTVLPAEWSENCPFSVMESQSLMTPVLGAKIGGIPELIDDGKTGILFESGNLKELTEKIEYLYNNKELCRQMSENCRDIKYDTIQEYSEKLIKLYKEVIK